MFAILLVTDLCPIFSTAKACRVKFYSPLYRHAQVASQSHTHFSVSLSLPPSVPPSSSSPPLSISLDCSACFAVSCVEAWLFIRRLVRQEWTILFTTVPHLTNWWWVFRLASQFGAQLSARPPPDAQPPSSIASWCMPHRGRQWRLAAKLL